MVMNISAKLWLLILALFVFFCLPLCAADVKVSAEIDPENYDGEPLKGTITITHDKNEPIDTNSFMEGKNTLSAEFIKEVQISPDNPLVLSIYQFTLPAKREGLYALPSISVKVGRKIYQSPMSSYSIKAKRQAPTAKPVVPTAPQAPTGSSKATKPLLRLEASVDGSKSLYPGQRTRLVYYYFYSGNIGLTAEKLPLLDAEGFIKIGEKEINDYVQGNVSVREISQQVEAVAPGKYTFGPSLIEGHSNSEKLSSEAPPVVLTVMPFPETDKPASFNGAVGQFTFKTSLLSSSDMTLGDEITLGLIISGKGNLKNITVSDLCCQPGMSGFFRLSDIPPAEKIEGDTKTIAAKIRPLNTLIKEVPSLEFSFFDPKSSKYVVLHSESIPITIKPGPSQTEEQAAPSKPQIQQAEQEIKNKPTPAPIQIESIVPLKSCDLYNRPFGTWWALTILPFAILLLLYQKHLKEYLEWKKNQKQIVTSRELFQRAFADQKKGKCDEEMLKASLKMAMEEAGLITSANIKDKELPDEGLGREVKSFFAALDEKRFAGKGSYNVNEIHHLSGELLKKIYALTKTPGVSI